MTDRRIIIRMDMGRAPDGPGAAQIAADKGLRAALDRADLPVAAALGLPDDAVRIVVSIGVPDGAGIDGAQLVARVGGRCEVRVVPGGQRVHGTVVATVAVEAFLPVQTGWTVAPG